MDCFSIACGLAGISPHYFWRVMDLAEFQAIVKSIWMEWEKTRVISIAMGHPLKLPWDNLQEHKKSIKQKYTVNDRLNLAKQLQKLQL